MDLVTPRILLPHVTVATDGYATPSILRNWLARGYFSTTIPRVEPSKGLLFPMLSVYEAAMLSWGAQQGIFDLVRMAWLARRNDANDGDKFITTARDFKTIADYPDVFWGFYDIRQMPLSGPWADHDLVMRQKGCLGGTLVNVSALARRVQRNLSAVIAL